MKKWIFLLILVFVVVSCSPMAPTSTDTPQPSATVAPTSTPIPLSEIDLESIIIIEGDLSAGYSGAQIRDFAPEKYTGWRLRPAQNTIYQELEKNGEESGGITIFLYDSQEHVEGAYSQIVDGVLNDNVGHTSYDPDDAEFIDTVGENATAIYYSRYSIFESSSVPIAEIVFVRCEAVVHIRMEDTGNSLDSIVAYARRLDSRLQGLVCR